MATFSENYKKNKATSLKIPTFHTSINKNKLKQMAQVKKGDKIKVHYHGKLTTGETFDTSEGREPLAFEVGSGMVIKGFDDGVTGMQVGEKITIQIPVDEAYGPKNPDMLVKMPKDRFPQDLEIQVGIPLMMSDQNGQQFQVVVTEIADDGVTLDANHPLAGQDLIFDLELVEIEGGSPLIITP
ncbi:MAG: peptidylprolyl isomerase [Niabella sp.]